ncbi:unnamed protein product, partial [Laminaria digitata]
VVEDISPSRLTPREVQKIALLDMRILNRDRNSVNILVRSRPRRSCSFSDRNRQGSGGEGGAEAGGGGRRLARFQEGKTEYELIPIDHGLCLSDELVIDWCDWCWLNWRQVK